MRERECRSPKRMYAVCVLNRSCVFRCIGSKNSESNEAISLLFLVAANTYGCEMKAEKKENG